jgi:pentatricopeptide repeat protein
MPYGRPSDPAPDFRPEDLGVSPSLASAASTGVPVVVGRPSWPAIHSDEEGMPTDDALQTNTLAELYLRQGLVDKATEVYRGMLRVDPGNHKAARRLGELGQGAASQPSASAGTSAPRAEVAALSRPAVSKPAAVPVLQTKNDDSPRRDTIRRLERWLATVGAPAAKGGAPR